MSLDTMKQFIKRPWLIWDSKQKVVTHANSDMGQGLGDLQNYPHYFKKVNDISNMPLIFL